MCLSTLLLSAQYFLQKGRVRISIQYTAFCKEDITLYWNSGKGFTDEAHLTQSTNIKKNNYDFQIPALDSITEIRVDPDTKFNLATLSGISIEGLQKNLELRDLRKSGSNGLQIKEKAGLFYLQRKSDNNDPYLIFKLPPGAGTVNQSYTARDFLVITLCLLFSVLSTFILRKKIYTFSESHSFREISLATIFLLIISSYWSNSILHYYEAPTNIENRRLAKKPDLDSISYQGKKYFNDYTSWFNDHFAFKQLFVFANSFLRIHLFHSSPMPSSMYIGKQFQFFSANTLLRDDILGTRRLSVQEIHAIYANNLFKQDYLAKQHIAYYLTIPPSKQTVFEDLLPDYLLLQLKGKKMAEQFKDELALNKSNFYIDVIDLLKQRHLRYPNERIFYQYDLHWSDWGAFLAYRELINSIQKEHPWVGKALDFNEITLDTSYTEDADLSKLILMHKTFKKEKYTIKATVADSITETVVNGVYQFPVYKYKNPQAKGRVLVFRDSYSEQWKWLIARHFNESIFIWDQNITQSLINEYHPDIVIQENCEMFLFYLFNPLKTHD